MGCVVDSTIVKRKRKGRLSAIKVRSRIINTQDYNSP
jgi:hypothetical protein